MLRRIVSKVGSNSNGFGDKHIITSPTCKVTDLEGNKLRSRSILASAFENAWKRGNFIEKINTSQENLSAYEFINEIGSQGSNKNVPNTSTSHQPLKGSVSKSNNKIGKPESSRKSLQVSRSSPSRQFTTLSLVPIKEDLPPPSTPPPPPPFLPPPPPPSSISPLTCPSKTTSQHPSTVSTPVVLPQTTSRPPPPLTRPPLCPSTVRRAPPTTLLPSSSLCPPPSPQTTPSPPYSSSSNTALPSPLSAPSASPVPKLSPSPTTTQSPPVPPRPFPPNYRFHPRSSMAFKLSIESSNTSKHSFIHPKAAQAPTLPRTSSLA